MVDQWSNSNFSFGYGPAPQTHEAFPDLEELEEAVIDAAAQNPDVGTYAQDWAPYIFSQYINIVGLDEIYSLNFGRNYEIAATTTDDGSTWDVVQDEDGAITGVRGQILESFSNLSRATDAKNESGESIYYYNVIDNQSRWLLNGGKVIRPAGETQNSTATYTNTAINMTNTVVTNTVPFTRSFKCGRDGGIVNTGTVHVTTAGSEDWGDTNIAIAKITDGYDLFKNAEEIDISLVLTFHTLTYSLLASIMFLCCWCSSIGRATDL